jgi:hypothetical protein
MKDVKQLILETLVEKEKMKDQVYTHTMTAFGTLSKVLNEIIEDYNKELPEESMHFEMKIRGKYDYELKVANDVLIFTISPNVFEFDRSHGIWKTSYVQDNILTNYAGIINIYNFISDSFKFNRGDDIGYLIGRIFVNKDNHYFVEGKRQLGFLYNDFQNAVLDKEEIRKIVNSAILYCLDFDILVPPYDNVKIATVNQMQEKIKNTQTILGKRMGFRFYMDNEVAE